MFSKNEHYLIFPHKFLDGDCIGSAKALKILIEHSGAVAYIMTTEDPSKTKWDYLNVKTLNRLPPKFSACILVDCASPDRTSFPVPPRVPVFIIDHHEELNSYGDGRIIDTTAVFSLGGVVPGIVFIPGGFFSPGSCFFIFFIGLLLSFWSSLSLICFSIQSGVFFVSIVKERAFFPMPRNKPVFSVSSDFSVLWLLVLGVNNSASL